METYEHLNDNHPTNADERAVMVVRLLDLIERTNAAIDRHTNQDKPDQLAVRQYTELRDEYVQEFADLVQPIGLVVQGPPARQAA
ncbi:hypothetical protein [Spirosoma linguale]|uniref:Uncharacterized protein n=1 Tax=Spirosoma linguale (strain ATCC 33905 / DSM 74 / LMG 10896 / Claus 1) TaxID=504472 RepID=D2QSQ1_SPILD|nr:hypothetical protein Slin_5869 [Spirosoma linguale DSM 74]